MPVAGGQGQLALAGRFVINGEIDFVGLIRIQGGDLVRARLLHIDRVVAPFPVRRPANVKLVLGGSTGFGWFKSAKSLT